MNDNLELVERLVEKTGISYTEAKAALEKADWDILDALINLEAEGRVSGASSYSTRAESAPKAEEERREQKTEYEKGFYEKGFKEKSERAEEYKKNTVSVFEWLRSVFDKGNTNNIELYRNGSRIIGMPITVFVILCLLSFGTVLVVMLVSLFFGIRYRFSGPDLGKDSINHVMGKATDVADDIKRDIKNATDKRSDDNRD